MIIVRYLLFLCILLSISCASIPGEAPILSQELGKQIQELESSHLKLVQTFFNLKRQNVKDYINTVWLPRFAENYFQEEEIASMWQFIVNEGTTEDRLQFILATAPELQNELNNQYQRMIAPLDQLENELELSLKQKYSNTKSINNSLTSFLVSASEIDQNRQRYLNMIGVSDDKISNVIDDTESITSQMLVKANTSNSTYDDIQLNIQKYQEKLNEIINRL